MQINNPIFIVGFPRSGTTFLQSLLATQSNVISFPETHFYSILTGHLDLPKNLTSDEYEDVLERADRYLLLADDLSTLREFRAKRNLVDRKELFECLISILSKRQGVELTVSRTMVEKTPSHAYHMDKIISDYPDARFIQIIRHPIDAISSYMQHLAQGQKDLGQVIQEWIRSYDAVENFRTSNRDKLLTVRYESLAANTELEMVRISKFLRLPLDTDLLQTYTESAADLIMPFENWKSSNQDAGFTIDSYHLSVKDRAMIQFLLNTRMVNQEYKVRNKMFQSLYNLKNGGGK